MSKKRTMMLSVAWGVALGLFIPSLMLMNSTGLHNYGWLFLFGMTVLYGKPLLNEFRDR